MFLFKALWWLLKHYSFCALWKGAFSGMNHPISCHGFYCFPFWIQCMCPLYTDVQPSKELCDCGVGVSLLHVNIYFSLCLLISHICTQLPFCYSMFYFIFTQILAIIDLGLFFSFVSFFRHSNFPLSQDLYYWSPVVHFTLANVSIPIPIGLTLGCWPIWELASS